MPLKFIAQKFWLPILIYYGFITFLSATSVQQPRFAFDFFLAPDKLFHFVLYACFGILPARFFLRFSQRFPVPFSVLFVFFVIFVFVLAGLDELHQSFYSHRSNDIYDFFFDVFGAFFGAGVYFFLIRFTNLQERAVFSFLFFWICFFVVMIVNGLQYKEIFFPQNLFLVWTLRALEFFLLGMIIARFLKIEDVKMPWRWHLLFSLVVLILYFLFLGFLKRPFELFYGALTLVMLFAGGKSYRTSS